MKEVYIISTGDIVAGRIAGAQRVMKFQNPSPLVVSVFHVHSHI